MSGAEATPLETPPPEGAIGRGGALALLSAFRHRNYRLFFFGQLVSLMGTWMQSVAQGWLVYSMTHSPLLLGLTSFAGQVPVFFITAFGGTIADRVNKRQMLIVTQSLSMLQAAVLAGLTLAGVIHVWEIVALAASMGLINAFDVPTRQALTFEMVGREDLRNAIALNSVMFNLARIAGPTMAGLLIALAGEGICFALNALSYAAVLASLIMMRLTPREKHPAKHPLRELATGAAYAWHTRQIRVALMLVAVSSCFGAAYIPLMPAVARDVLHQGSRGLGLLMGSVGVGALIGAYALARIHERHLTLTPILAAASFGVSLILFSHSHWLPLSMLLTLPCAFSLMLMGGSTNTILQTVSADHMRGRVLAFYTMAFIGMMPWGSLLLGWIASRLGVSVAISFGGAMCILGAVVAYLGRSRRHAIVEG
ncbi:MAG TPA: MFS transporter [Rhizomicrobium sp.]